MVLTFLEHLYYGFHSSDVNYSRSKDVNSPLKCKRGQDHPAIRFIVESEYHSSQNIGDWKDVMIENLAWIFQLTIKIGFIDKIHFSYFLLPFSFL